MREILFRGKRIDNGEWVYGDLVHAVNKFYISYYYESALTTFINETFEYDGISIIRAAPFIEVDPSTIGQYTGLTDKNGKKIFEGDIILRRYVRPNFLVEYSEEETEYQANFIGGGCASLYKYFSSKESKVIGNIHDNPELLEDKL